MKQGYLSRYFSGIAAKRLSVVEVNAKKSNQHEFHGIEDFCNLFGRSGEILRFPATFVWLEDDDDKCVTDNGQLSWYDSRRNDDSRPAEYRFYYKNNDVNKAAGAGDLLVIAQKTDGSLLVIIAAQGSTVERQILWLFDIPRFEDCVTKTQEALENGPDRDSFAARFILGQIGIAAENTAEAHLETLLHRFGGKFPATAAFSAFARGTLPHIHPRDDADGALMAWMEQEEALFRALEKHLLQQQLQALVHNGADTDDFLDLAKSALQRRKARAGAALEHHLQHILEAWGIRHSRGGITEGRLKPDFIFPGIVEYHQPQFPVEGLAMLAVKTTCKDRWRQILNEAARIPHKHLFTLEPGISENQTDEMQKENVQLVLPRELHDSYTARQQFRLMTLGRFVSEVADRRKR